MFHYTMRPVFLAFVFLSSFSANAKLLQIIHTNDLHSHFDRAQRAEFGGYAALKAAMDKLRSEAAEQGIETLVLDGGDFSEGTQHYFADGGAWSWKMLDALGFDAVTLGNHDYLMGMPQLDRLVGRVNPAFRLVCANLDAWGDFPNLERHLRPYAEFRRAGARIGVMGLTADAFEYRWRVGQLAIDSSYEAVSRFLPELRSRNDFVIALSHLGIGDERRLARSTTGFDLSAWLPTPRDERHAMDAAARFESAPTWPVHVERKGRERSVDAKDVVARLAVDGDRVDFTLRLLPTGGLSPAQVVESLFGLTPEEAADVRWMKRRTLFATAEDVRT